MDQLAESSSSARKQKWTSFTITVWHALFMNWLSQGDRTVVLQVNEEWIPHMVKFMIAHARFFLAGGPRRCTKMLRFVGSLKEPIYTNEILTHEDNQPLQVQLIDIKTGEICSDLPVYVEIVVLDGDFGSDEDQVYTHNQFEKSILGPRNQKGPLLISCKEKKLVKTLENGRAIFKDLKITDNSTLAKNKKFRLGVQVKLPPNYQGLRIEIDEGWTEDFRVKDIRNKYGEKHNTPSLNDQIWRLKNIAKGGTYHQRLLKAFFFPVQTLRVLAVRDFLNMLDTDPNSLKSTLQMTEKKWNETVKQATEARIPRETAQFPSSTVDLPPHPLQNPGVWQHVVPRANFEVHPMSDLNFTIPTFNEGTATNFFVPGETSMFISRGYANEAITLPQFLDVSSNNPLNTGMLQQVNTLTNSEVYQMPNLSTPSTFNEGGRKRPQPEQAKSISRKRRRTSFTITVLHALFNNWVRKASSTAVMQVNTESIQHMFEFMSGHAGFFVAGHQKRSHIMAQQKEEAEPPLPPTKKLRFVGSLKEPIYTNDTLTNKDNQPLEVQLIDTKTGETCTDLPVCVEIVVLDGDFGSDEQQDYTHDQFEKSILGPKNQKGPLLISFEEKKLVKALEEGRVIFKGLKITDNSTLAKNKKFRLGAHVKLPQTYRGPRIKAGWTEDFRVKESRGKKGEKHDVPSLDDEVWRLKNIAEGGIYHQRLLSFTNSEGEPVIKTVRDFLNVLDILGPENVKNTLKITENKWGKIVQQANKARIPGETYMHNSGGNETELILEPPLENMGVLQQLDSEMHSQFDQTTINLITNQVVERATNCLDPGETSTRSVFTSRGSRAEANPSPQFSFSTEDLSHLFYNTGMPQQMDSHTDFGGHQILDSLEISIPVLNEDEATPQDIAELLYSQSNMNQYDFGGELSNIANCGLPYFRPDGN